MQDLYWHFRKLIKRPVLNFDIVYEHFRGDEDLHIAWKHIYEAARRRSYHQFHAIPNEEWHQILRIAHDLALDEELGPQWGNPIYVSK